MDDASRRLSRRTLLGTVLPTPSIAQDGRRQRDAAGRESAIPARINRVFPAGPPASILVWSLAPDLLRGWPGRALREAELVFMAPRAAELPAIGHLTGRDNTANAEAVLAQRPDLVLDYGSVRGTHANSR